VRRNRSLILTQKLGSKIYYTSSSFTFLKEKTNATAGNLSVQIQKLKEAGYIDVIKQFKDNYPQTICKVTSIGIKAFEEYVKNLQTYLQK